MPKITEKEIYKKHAPHKIAINLLKKGVEVDLKLTGHCMRPIMQENDTIHIIPIPFKSLNYGDIAVFFIEDNRIKTHRFIRFKRINGKLCIITKSDRRKSYDPPIPISQFLGIVSCVKRGNKIYDFCCVRWRKINFLLSKLSRPLGIIEFGVRLPFRIIYWLIRVSLIRVS
ncbi:MAG: hypothetical protein ACEPOW_08285 [Bacteroidales bacterium]